MKKIIQAVVIASLAIPVIAFAADYSKHPDLKAAHDSITTALGDLKKANDHEKGEFGGHRVKAEKLLQEAQSEIELAAEAANSGAADKKP